MSPKEQADIRRKLRILSHGKENTNVSKTCRYFGISREKYYKWKRDYEAKGEVALINSKPCPENPKIRIAPEIEAKIIHLRTTYYLSQLRISWYLQRYHGTVPGSQPVFTPPRPYRSAAGNYPEIPDSSLSAAVIRKLRIADPFKDCNFSIAVNGST